MLQHVVDGPDGAPPLPMAGPAAHVAAVEQPDGINRPILERPS